MVVHPPTPTALTHPPTAHPHPVHNANKGDGLLACSWIHSAPSLARFSGIFASLVVNLSILSAAPIQVQLIHHAERMVFGIRRSTCQGRVERLRRLWDANSDASASSRSRFRVRLRVPKVAAVAT